MPLNNEETTIIMSEHNSERINLQITKHRFLNLQTHHTKSGAISLRKIKKTIMLLLHDIAQLLRNLLSCVIKNAKDTLDKQNYRPIL